MLDSKAFQRCRRQPAGLERTTVELFDFVVQPTNTKPVCLFARREMHTGSSLESSQPRQHEREDRSVRMTVLGRRKPTGMLRQPPRISSLEQHIRQVGGLVRNFTDASNDSNEDLMVCGLDLYVTAPSNCTPPGTKLTDAPSTTTERPLPWPSGNGHCSSHADTHFTGRHCSSFVEAAALPATPPRSKTEVVCPRVGSMKYVP